MPYNNLDFYFVPEPNTGAILGREQQQLITYAVNLYCEWFEYDHSQWALVHGPIHGGSDGNTPETRKHITIAFKDVHMWEREEHGVAHIIVRMTDKQGNKEDGPFVDFDACELFPVRKDTDWMKNNPLVEGNYYREA